ncbi:hypothetical protein [Kitasatospora sp. NPDC054795]
MFAAFVPSGGGAGSGSLVWTVPLLRWSAVASALLALPQFVLTLRPL